MPVQNTSKKIQDYFQPYAHPSAPKASARPSTSPTQPPGLTIINDFITPAEESQLLAFLDTQPWRTDLSRRTIHYGGTYCLMPPRQASPSTRAHAAEIIITASAIPAELDFLIDRMVAQGLYAPSARPEFCIVNEYTPGLGISAHVENFRFGEPVCALTLAGADEMRFHELAAEHDGSVRTGRAAQAERTGRKRDVRLERRGLMGMRGHARRKWQHEIVRGRKKGKTEGWRRVSLTFRVEVKAGKSVV